MSSRSHPHLFIRFGPLVIIVSNNDDIPHRTIINVVIARHDGELGG